MSYDQVEVLPMAAGATRLLRSPDGRHMVAELSVPASLDAAAAALVCTHAAGGTLAATGRFTRTGWPRGRSPVEAARSCHWVEAWIEGTGHRRAAVVQDWMPPK